ncbi:type II toxin-antitoxin system RelE/ParE family toxin [Thermosynechococcaceae cyanobacterium BACA0444]|uniref:Type II toxin-antitoxin system RelE/ParE family toxin n=1 Tax=Pseudocalidococcus azoricus BACA0444 TaxID=2918990 RepID=A0AAE4FU63_9CYAN|nr:type II toxin-antitoxin system RelE/ParE family toxin [Pseudocalidococcus azoricus]MDS3861938.1 type II toxin-antitoxin system RelE/ParE family toxin [Pseudocalidococcus azoricus BACA0444]
MRVQEYLKDDGSSPYQKWFDGLDVIAAAKVTVAKSRLELGNTSNIKWFDGIGEYKINWGPGYRIYLAQDGKELIILFGGGTKKTQQSDIEQAKELYQEYKNRKKQVGEVDTKKGMKNKKRG